MSDNERELFEIVRNSADPSKVMGFMMDLFAKFLKGESVNAGNVA